MLLLYPSHSKNIQQLLALIPRSRLTSHRLNTSSRQGLLIDVRVVLESLKDWVACMHEESKVILGLLETFAKSSVGERKIIITFG